MRCSPHVGNHEPELVHEAPRPRLAGLERADQRVAAAACVCAGMAVGRVVAAADLAALQADAQMQPRFPRGQAFLTAIHRLGQLGDPNLIEMGAGGHSLTVVPLTSRAMIEGSEARVLMRDRGHAAASVGRALLAS